MTSQLNLTRGTYRSAEVFRALVDAGWSQRRISGSHYIFSRAGCRSLPVAVHGGKLRRDVVQNVMRQSALHIEKLEVAVDEPATSASNLQPVSASTTPPALDAVSSVRSVDQTRWAESSLMEQAAFHKQAERSEKKMQEAVQAFQQQLQAAQLELLDGDYAAVDSRLTSLLSEGCTRLCERCGYACVADALFFLATALCTLARGCRPVGAAPSQQLVTRAISTCHQLQQLHERRDDAKALQGSLLSWVYQSYACDLLNLAISQKAEEFKDTDRVAHAFANMAASNADAAADIVGRSARLEGLKSRADLNGRSCHVEAHVAAKDRFQVCVDGSRESVLVKRLNLRLPEVAGQSCRLVGGLSEELDAINLNLMRGFAFIVQLVRADEHLVSDNDIPWPRQGIEAIARATITHYERGHLAEACAVFEAIEFVCMKHAVTFDEEQREQWRMVDTLMPGHREKKMRDGTGASDVLGTATTMRVLAQACLRMRGAHALAADKLMWSRTLGFSDAHASSKPMREGWAAVLAAAKREQCSRRPLSWEDLSAFMDLFFEGMEYAVANSDALRTTQAITFVTQNLVDPVLLIHHHCRQLHLSSKILSRALQGFSDSGDVAVGRDDGKLDPDWMNQIAHSRHHQLRLQLVTMLLWVVRLRQLFHELDDLVEVQMTSDDDGGGLFGTRLDTLPSLIEYLDALISTCCQPPWHRSTLIDILTKNLSFNRVLDYHRYRPVYGADVSALDPGAPAARLKAMFVIDMSKELPLFLRWFTASDAERKALAVKYGLMNRLMGFGDASYDGGRLANEQQCIRTGLHDGQFSCHAFEMLELLGKFAGATPTWESVANALLYLRGEAAGSRQAQRRGEVQKKARRICNVVRQLSARFPSSVIDELSKRRTRAYSELLAIIDKLVRALHAERPAETSSKGAGWMPYTQMDGMGARMPEWTAYDLHQLSMHAVALAKLATEVNIRAREAFGGNFPELVWVSDCYEYNPANAQKDMAPIHANQQELRQAVLVLSQVLATPVIAAPSPAPAPVLPGGELDDLASADDGLSSSTRRRGGKKSKKKS